MIFDLSLVKTELVVCPKHSSSVLEGLSMDGICVKDEF